MQFNIQHFKELPSTNTLALELASKQAEEGLVIVADYQTQGRGKPGRKWVSPPGKNLLFSLLLRPPLPPHRAPILTQITCRSVAKVLHQKYGISSHFKRPNDILVKNRKICGVLVESSSSSKGKLDYAVIGVGLNVNAKASELVPEATSIKEVTEKEVKKENLLNEILTQLESDLKALYDSSS